MFLQFRVSNFLSINEPAIFSMLDSNYNDNRSLICRDYRMVSSAVIYGANASGKSNILKAMNFMKEVIVNSPKVIQSTDKLPHLPFRLHTSTEESSSSFEIVFFIENLKYRYGFELDANKIYSEWLFEDTNGKEAKLFYRDAEENDYVNERKFKEGVGLFDKQKKKITINENQLFLWVCDRLKQGTISHSILKWFSNFNFIDGTNSSSYMSFALKKMQSEDNDFKKKIVNLIKMADIGIENAFLKEEELSDEEVQKISFPLSLKAMLREKGSVYSIKINTIHKKFNDQNNEVDNVIFELDKDESIGTQKLFRISAPILDTLEHGKVLLIDELDSSLHPLLTKALINLFTNRKTNKSNAQLIFTTHDTNLLKPSIFTRDQIWFTEKNKFGATQLYSVLEIKGIRKDDDFEKYYIRGKYGAIPYIGEFEFSQ